MKKCLVVIILGLTIGNLYSQDSSYSVINRVKVLSKLENVKDFKLGNESFYFLLENDSLIIINTTGTRKNVQYVNKKNGIEVSGSKIISISSNSPRTTYLKNESSPIKTQAKFITSYQNGYFTCKITGNSNKISYNSLIVFVDSEGNETPLSYIQGNPSGIFQKDGKLYFLTKKSSASKNGLLITYNLDNNKIESENTIPVTNPVGLSIDNSGVVYTYSIYSNEVIKLKIQ